MPPDSSSIDVFISYARRDGLERARRLQDALIANGFTTWRDERSLDPDADFTAELETGIERSRRVVCCVTPDVRRADSFVRRELGYALAVGKPIVPLVFDDTIPPISIVNVTREDFTHVAWDSALHRLVARLQGAEAAPQLARDPFGDYLVSLYREIVATIRQLVFTEIELQVELSPRTAGASTAIPATLSKGFLRGPRLGQPRAGDTPSTRSVRAAFASMNERLLLIGAPGAGKTVGLLGFARDAVARRLDDIHQPLPLLAQIMSWTTHDPSVSAWLAREIPALGEDAIARTIRSGDALLILDGLDELTPKCPHGEFLAQLPRTGRLLVSSRPSVPLDDNGDSPFAGIARLLPFDDRQLAQYTADSRRLQQSLAADPMLKDLARTPLFLAILRYCYSQLRAGADLSADLARSPAAARESIFDLYVRRRLEHEQSRPTAGPAFTEDELYDVLGRAAFHEAPDEPITDSFENADIVRAVETMVGRDSAGAVLRYCAALQLLVSDARGGYRFSHVLLRRHFGRRACLAAWGRRSIWRGYGPGTRDWDTAQAMKKMAWFGDERDVGLLIEAVQDNESHLRAFAMMALGGIANPAAAPLLCSLLADKHRWHIEAAYCDVACWALIQIGEAALPAIEDLVGSLPGTHVVTLALLVLSRIRGESSRRLAATLTDDERQIDKSHAGSNGSEVVAGYVRERTVGELARRVVDQLAANAAPPYDRCPFLRERGATQWIPWG